MSELIEEHSRAAKYYGQTGTYVFHSRLPTSFKPEQLLGHHIPASTALLDRIASFHSDVVLRRMPYRLPPKLLPYMASHLAFIPSIHFLVHPRGHRPLPVVLLLLSPGHRIPRAGSPIRSAKCCPTIGFQGNRILLRDLRLARTTLPFLKSERQRQRSSYFELNRCDNLAHTYILS